MKNKYQYRSKFFKLIITYLSIFIFLITLYGIFEHFGLIAAYRKRVNVNGWYALINYLLIFSVLISYVLYSLYKLLSHRTVEDNREHCLPIILSPFFLIVENGLVHAFDFQFIDPYYGIVMGIFSTTALGVITFASLKFSFEMSSQKERFSETSSVKPDIAIEKRDDNTYVAKIKRQDCYLCGIFIGKITKILYLDIKRTGNFFELYKLFFTNKKILYAKDADTPINLKELGKDPPDLERLLTQNEVYFIFRDVKNFYYLAPIASKENYKVVGVNETVMERLVYKYSRNTEKNVTKIIKYKAMDWFNIPYNFYPEYRF